MSHTLRNVTFLLCLYCNLGICQVSLVRGPYLQSGTSSQITIRWRTSAPATSQINIGFHPGTYFRTIKDESPVVDHELTVDNLLPNTKYFYTVISDNTMLQGDHANHFTTYPAGDSDRMLRFWVTGDCGNNSDNQRSVRDQYLAYTKSQPADGWLLLGDNAYPNGTDAEYQTGFFDQYQNNVMKSTVLWPATGNHDYANNAALQDSKTIPYFDIFTLPSKGECGGVASNTEAYYSYDIGNIHFIALDSYGKEAMTYRMYDTLSPQIEWLKKDLLTNQKLWTIAYWHHPPYTKGSHDSDSEDELVKIRENVIRVLERFDVDLVLCGHSHSYERTKLIKGHLANASSFDPDKHDQDKSSGKYDGSQNSCPIEKHGQSKGEGIIYVVAGSAGQVGGATPNFPHPAMYYSNRSIGGSVVLEIEKNRLDLKWITSSGEIADRFTLMKDVGISRAYEINEGSTIELSASWIGNYTWEQSPSAAASRKVSPLADHRYVVRDSLDCLRDTFEVKVIPVTGIQEGWGHSHSLRVFPNPAAEHISISISGVHPVVLTLQDAFGKVLATRHVGYGMESLVTFTRDELNLKSGLYLITTFDGTSRKTRKLFIE